MSAGGRRNGRLYGRARVSEEVSVGGCASDSCRLLLLLSVSGSDGNFGPHVTPGGLGMASVYPTPMRQVYCVRLTLDQQQHIGSTSR